MKARGKNHAFKFLLQESFIHFLINDQPQKKVRQISHSDRKLSR